MRPAAGSFGGSYGRGVQAFRRAVAAVARGEEQRQREARNGRAQHAGAAVLELSLAQPLDVEKVGEIERVEARLCAG